jgi:RND family efflux transporter MFP subunit
MTTIVQAASIALLIALCAACETKAGPALPPATGAGAPPAPRIPSLTALAEQSPAAARATPERAGTGTLTAIDKADLGPKETGVLTAITVDEGDRVKKGQVLFRLDSVPAQLAVAQAETAVTTARVQLDAAKLDYDRTRALRERGSIHEDALDQSKSRYDAAASAVKQAQAAVSLAQRHLANMVVTSPIDGVVTEKRMNVGETATMMPPSVVLVVQNVDKLELRARLPESALRQLREGSELQVSFPALGERRRVPVKRIAPTVDPRTRTIQIVAEVPNEDHRLKAGMLVEVAYDSGVGAEAGMATATAPATTTATAAGKEKGKGKATRAPAGGEKAGREAP